MIFDTHAHYDNDRFTPDRDALLRRLHEECGVSCIVNPAMHLASAKKALALATQYDFIYAGVGIHPNYADRWNDTALPLYHALLDAPKVVAVGEIGLDYYRQKDNRAQQCYVFETMLSLAKERNLPAIIHNREAHGDMYRLLREYRPAGVLHCFSGSVELMREAVSLGLYIGMGGSVTFEGAVRPLEVARAVPLDRLVLETDAPYLIPLPCRTRTDIRERSDSSMIRAVAAFIAAQRGMETDELLRVTEQNARRLYRMDE